jgi:hypothetical protein
MEVAPTLFANPDDAPDDYVVHLEEQDATRNTDLRVATLKMNLGLDAAGLRLASSIGLEDALALKHAISNAMRTTSRLVWSGMPRYPDIEAVVNVICSVRGATTFGALTTRHLTFLINSLRMAPTIRQFLLDHDREYRGKAEAHDNVFKFLRACEYGLPQHFAVAEVFVKQQDPRADYSLFISSLSRWFKAEELKNLDEEGIPIQISERFYAGESREVLSQKLLSLARLKSNQLTPF